MPEILHEFPIFAPPDRVFEAISTPEGLDRWWTLTSAGKAATDAVWKLGFGPDYVWEARVTRCEPGQAFEWELTSAEPDWVGARIGFRLTAGDDRTNVRFHHLGWPEASKHYRISSYCWAMYLRILKRWLEHGETVAYENRLDV